MTTFAGNDNQAQTCVYPPTLQTADPFPPLGQGTGGIKRHKGMEIGGERSGECDSDEMEWRG